MGMLRLLLLDPLVSALILGPGGPRDHLASALVAADSFPDFAVLSLDRPVRSTSLRPGLRVLPE